MRFLFFVGVLLGASVAQAADFKVGQDAMLSSVSACITLEAAEVVADAARKTGSGQAAWDEQVANGLCSSVSMNGTIVAIVDTYPESISPEGKEDIVEFTVNGLKVYVFAPHGAVALAGTAI